MGYYDLVHRSYVEAFGFRVYRPIPSGLTTPDPEYPPDRYDAGEEDPDSAVPPDNWALGLPHQCDSWAIAMGTDREAVLAEARRFRDELGQAIAELERG